MPHRPWIASALALALALVLSHSRRAHATEDIPERFHFVIGDLRPGAGIAIGFDYVQTGVAGGTFDLRAGSRLSHRLYQRHEVQIGIPRLAHDRVFADILFFHRSYTEIDYFGIGPDSTEENHSDYRISGPALYGTLGYRPNEKVAFGGRMGVLQSSLGSGRSGDLPSVEETFGEGDLPGRVEEPDYVLFGGFLSLDRRNAPEETTAGAYYEVRATLYRDRGFDRFDFEELWVEALHFIPLDPRWTLATRARGQFTRAAAGEEIPFFLLPTLGGVHSLLAFENDRFRDRQLLLLNAELRYQLRPSIRLEALLDVGQVFRDFDSLRLGGFELSSGVGARYKFGERLLVGVNLGVGREGARVGMTGSFRF
jgi:hypothetical protein